jgi:chromosome segregation ATPase
MAKDPFNDDDDDSQPSGGENAIQSQTSVSDEPTTIRVDEHEDDEDSSDKPELTEEQKASRREKRQARKSQFEEARTRADQAEREAQTARAEAAAAREAARQAAEWMQRSQAGQQQQQDPYASHEAHLKERYNLVLEKAAILNQKGESSEEKVAALRNELFTVQQQQAQLAAARQNHYANLQAQQYQQQYGQQSEAQRDAQAVMQRLRMDYPDVLSHGSAWTYAQAKYAELASTGKLKQNQWESIGEIMQETRRAFGMARSPAPSETTKRRFSGIGGGANGASQSSSGRTVVMGKAEKGMARSMYPDLYKKDPQKAFQRWARECGQDKGDDD